VPAEDLPIAHLTELCASIRELFDAKACVCAVVDHAAGRLEFVAGDGAGVGLLMGQRLLVGEGIAGYVAQTGLPVEVHDAPTDERFAARFSVDRAYVPASLLAAPLTAPDERVIGVLTVLDPAREVLEEADDEVGSALPLLQVVAGQISDVLVGQAFPDSVYAGPGPSTFASADANRR
jgi:signal transduction protein with GAF and PtsI domain